MLAETAYGKSSVRLVQVSRHGDRDDLKDFTVAVRFEGEYDQSFTDGDNRDVLPTDTMKNTVYALAARHPVEEPEAFGRLLAESLSRTQSTTAARADRSARNISGGESPARRESTVTRSCVTAPSRARRRCRARAISSRSAPG